MLEHDDLNKINKECIVKQNATDEERQVEIGLRPQKLDDFIGQNQLKENLRVSIEAAHKRGEPVEHVLLYGNPGLGKTTLAHIIANEMGGQIRVTSGPALERVGDLAAILSNLGAGDILFIDEIHRMNKTIEEVLYPAMEDYALDIVVGKGPTARTLRLSLEKFTIIGATTRLSLLSSPLRDRFGITFHLDFYENEDLEKILHRSSNILDVPIDNESVCLLSARCRQTPRIANRLLRRVRDFAQVRSDGNINQNVCHSALNLLDIDDQGLDRTDRMVLETIIKKFNGGPVGLSTIAAATQEEISTIEEIHEPFLLKMGMLQRTPRGRTVTKAGYMHLGLQMPKQTLI
ncbi:MAG: Holliday junction branch migration DNA helicase RuvB [Patescibacteria group bacterium]